MTPVDRYLSEKITRLSFLAAVMVVLLHATQMLCTDAVTHGNWLYRILTGPVTGWAVPFFFMVSGFWFGEKDVADWRLFYGKKLKTLVVPYVLYAVIASVVTIPVLVLVNRQSGSPIWTSTIFAPGGLWPAVDGLIGITRQYGPVNAGYLWFVRALIVIFACAPVLKVVQHRLPYLLPAISLVLIFVPDMRRFVGIDTRVYYFFIGMGLSQCDVVPGRFGWRPLAVTGTLCVGVFVAWLLMGGGQVLDAFHFAVIAFGWVAYDQMDFSCGLSWWVKCSFWLYCTHCLILDYWVPVVHWAAGRSIEVMSLLIPVVALGCAAVSLLLWRIGNRVCPSLMSLLTGGR